MNTIGMHIANVTPVRPGKRRGYARAWLFVGNLIGIALCLSVIPVGVVLLMQLLMKVRL